MGRSGFNHWNNRQCLHGRGKLADIQRLEQGLQLAVDTGGR